MYQNRLSETLLRMFRARNDLQRKLYLCMLPKQARKSILNLSGQTSSQLPQSGLLQGHTGLRPHEEMHLQKVSVQEEILRVF